MALITLNPSGTAVLSGANLTGAGVSPTSSEFGVATGCGLLLQFKATVLGSAAAGGTMKVYTSVGSGVNAVWDTDPYATLTIAATGGVKQKTTLFDVAGDLGYRLNVTNDDANDYLTQYTVYAKPIPRAR
jgi:hypothetical protein